MIEIKKEDKQNFLDEHFPNEFKLTDMKECLHCGNIITVGDFKVFKDEFGEYICCPHAPDCDGTAIDWMPLGNRQ